MMNVRLDHVVHAVLDPAVSASQFATSLGWRVTAGGRHVHWGTYNWLAYFDGCYMEWVGVFDAELAAQNEFGRWLLPDLALAEGVAQLALRTRQMDALRAAWDEQQLPYVGPIPGERQREDGSILRWRLLFPARTENDVAQFPLPFVIEWEDEDAAREAGFVAAGLLAEQPAERWMLTSITIPVHDATSVVERWNRYFAKAGAPAALTDGGTGAVVDVGPRLCFSRAGGDAGALPVTERGERPLQMEVAAPAGSSDVKDVTLHGLQVVVRPSD